MTASKMPALQKSVRAGIERSLVRYRYHFADALLLGFRQRRGYVFKRGQVLVDVRLGVLDGNSPLLIPPVRLRHDAAIDHGKPVVAPQININRLPVAVV